MEWNEDIGFLKVFLKQKQNGPYFLRNLAVVCDLSGFSTEQLQISPAVDQKSSEHFGAERFLL